MTMYFKQDPPDASSGGGIPAPAAPKPEPKKAPAPAAPASTSSNNHLLVILGVVIAAVVIIFAFMGHSRVQQDELKAKLDAANKKNPTTQVAEEVVEEVVEEVAGADAPEQVVKTDEAEDEQAMAEAAMDALLPDLAMAKDGTGQVIKRVATDIERLTAMNVGNQEYLDWLRTESGSKTVFMCNTKRTKAGELVPRYTDGEVLDKCVSTCYSVGTSFGISPEMCGLKMLATDTNEVVNVIHDEDLPDIAQGLQDHQDSMTEQHKDHDESEAKRFKLQTEDLKSAISEDGGKTRGHVTEDGGKTREHVTKEHEKTRTVVNEYTTNKAKNANEDRSKKQNELLDAMKNAPASKAGKSNGGSGSGGSTASSAPKSAAGATLPGNSRNSGGAAGVNDLGDSTAVPNAWTHGHGGDPDLAGMNKRQSDKKPEPDRSAPPKAQDQKVSDKTSNKPLKGTKAEAADIIKRLAAVGEEWNWSDPEYWDAVCGDLINSAKALQDANGPDGKRLFGPNDRKLVAEHHLICVRREKPKYKKILGGIFNFGVRDLACDLTFVDGHKGHGCDDINFGNLWKSGSQTILFYKFVDHVVKELEPDRDRKFTAPKISDGGEPDPNTGWGNPGSPGDELNDPDPEASTGGFEDDPTGEQPAVGTSGGGGEFTGWNTGNGVVSGGTSGSSGSVSTYVPPGETADSNSTGNPDGEAGLDYDSGSGSNSNNQWGQNTNPWGDTLQDDSVNNDGGEISADF